MAASSSKKAWAPLKSDGYIEVTPAEDKIDPSGEGQLNETPRSDEYESKRRLGVLEPRGNAADDSDKPTDKPSLADAMSPSGEASSAVPHQMTAIDLLQTPSDHVAKQITILDMAIFRKIRTEELLDGAWTKKEKFDLAPNVVELTRRFNHLSFWVAREVLHAGSLDERALLIGYFIKVAKSLRELKNFHATMAVISALRSAPIHRLTKTWARIKSKLMDQYMSITNLVSEQDNYILLRDQVKVSKPPCIPYLGIHLTDLVHLSCAAGENKEQEQSKAYTTIQSILKFQESQYDFAEDPDLCSYLNSLEYTDDLTKMIEDNNYKLSLKLQPKEEMTSAKDVNSPFNGKSLPYRIKSDKDFKKGHRKARSLGTGTAFWQKIIDLGSPSADSSLLEPKENSDDSKKPVKEQQEQDVLVNTTGAELQIPSVTLRPRSAQPLTIPRPLSVTTAISASSDDLVSNSGLHNELSESENSSEDEETDDILLPLSDVHIDRYDAARLASAPAEIIARNISSSSGLSLLSESSLDELTVVDDLEFDIEGCLQRKRGSSRLSSYKKYWVAVSDKSIFFFSSRKVSKSKGENSERQFFSNHPSSKYSLESAQLSVGDDVLDRKFAIHLGRKGKVVLLKADSSTGRGNWVNALAQAMNIDVSKVGHLKAPRTPLFHRRNFNKLKHPAMAVIGGPIVTAARASDPLPRSNPPTLRSASSPMMLPTSNSQIKLSSSPLVVAAAGRKQAPSPAQSRLNSRSGSRVDPIPSENLISEEDFSEALLPSQSDGPAIIISDNSPLPAFRGEAHDCPDGSADVEHDAETLVSSNLTEDVGVRQYDNLTNTSSASSFTRFETDEV